MSRARTFFAMLFLFCAIVSETLWEICAKKHQIGRVNANNQVAKCIMGGEFQSLRCQPDD